MAKDRFAGTNMRRRVMREERDFTASTKSANRAISAANRRAEKRATAPKQSVEEFLAAGGEITKCSSGVATEDEGTLLRKIPGTKNGYVRVRK